MQDILPLGCACGAVTGQLLNATADNGNYAVCYCDDCQAFARSTGGAAVMNDRGGTAIYQTTPSQVRISDPGHHLRAIRLTPKGLLRWYTDCCRTPVGNLMAAPRSPFVGLIHTFFAGDTDVLTREFGAPVALIQGRFAIGGCPEGVHPTASPAVIFRSIAFVGRGLWGGKHQPSAFIDAATGQPTAEVRVLTPTERAGLAAPSYQPSGE